ncbi:unnamed protein product [Urochloa decumbens]|uniref:CCHC-type domain-containing protein n=1 Tax=Urochloa decumbens TaxID=240449 RepID=A0ABC8Y8S4_9POAL
MQDRCLNCLSYGHRIATCRLPVRCRRCHGTYHIAKDCRRSRSPTDGATAGVVRRSPPRPQTSDARGWPGHQWERCDGPPTPAASAVPSRTPSPPPAREPARLIAHSTVPDNSPQLQPEPECCYVERTTAMAAEESRLRFALLAVVGNASTEFTLTDATLAISMAAGVRGQDLVVKPFHPEHFFIECADQGVRGRVLAATPVPLASTHLSILPWTRLVHAESETLLSKVTIEIDGIPAHAWDLDTASRLLAPSCWIEQVDDATERKTDMSTFKLTAWTTDPAALPISKKLFITEPEVPIMYADPGMQLIFGNVRPYLRQKRVLAYPVNFHLRTVADFRPRTPSTEPSSPSEDGDSGPDGHPDRSYGFCQGMAGPRLSSFPRRDGHGRRGGGGSGGGAATRQGTDAGWRNACNGPTGGTGSVAMEGPAADETTVDGDGALRNLPDPVSNSKNATSGAAEPRPAASPTGVSSLDGTPLVGNLDQGRAAPRSAAPLLQADHAAVCYSWRDSGAHAPQQQDPMLVEACLTMLRGQDDAGGDTSPSPTLAAEEEHPHLHGPPSIDVGPHLACSSSAHPVAQDVGLGLDQQTPSTTNSAEHDAATPAPDDDPPSPATPIAVPLPIPGPPEESSQLRAFAEEMLARIVTPLMARPTELVPVEDPPRSPPIVELPKRSLRQASMPLANVPPAKRAEVVLMKRLGLEVDVAPAPAAARKACKEYFSKERLPNPQMSAVQVLFPSLGKASPAMGLMAA